MDVLFLTAGPILSWKEAGSQPLSPAVPRPSPSQKEANRSWEDKALWCMCAVSSKQKIMHGGFPGGPVAKTLCSQCRVPGSNPWSGT